MNEQLTADLSRRRFLRYAGITGAGALAASALSWSTAERAFAFSTIAGEAGGDAMVLSTAIELENQAIFTYGAAIKSGLVTTPAVADVAMANQKDHQAHLEVLSAAVISLGGTPPAAKDSYPLPTTLTSETDVVTAAWKLEEVAVQAYYASIPKLTKPELRQAAASILGVEAQHVAILRSALKLDPVPKPFIADGMS